MNTIDRYKEIIDNTDLNLKKDLAKSLQENYSQLLKRVEIVSVTFKHRDLSITFNTPNDLQVFRDMLINDISFPIQQDIENAFKSIRENDMQKAMDKSGWFGIPSPCEPPRVIHHKEDPYEYLLKGKNEK